MIPWEKFKTPEEAYRWARAARSNLLLATCPMTGDHLVLSANITFLGYIVFKVDARQGRHGILSAAEVSRA